MPTNGSQTEILIRQGNINEAQLATKLEMGSERKEKEKKSTAGVGEGDRNAYGDVGETCLQVQDGWGLLVM